MRTIIYLLLSAVFLLGCKKTDVGVSKKETSQSSGQERLVLEAYPDYFIGIDIALLAYKLDIGRYPTTEEGLAVLFTVPKGDGVKWEGPYLTSPALDRWGHKIIYIARAEGDAHPYELRSLGSNPEDPSKVISNLVWPPFKWEL
jgi:general secretion pathway protein G